MVFDGTNSNAERWRVLNELNDEALVLRLSDGEHDALAVLFDRYHKLVFSVAARIVEDPGEAEEVVQTVFLDFYRGLATFDAKKGLLRVWLLQYAKITILPPLRCDFENDTFQIQHSYYWRRGGILKSTKTEASAKPLRMHPILKQALLEWRMHSHRNQPADFVFPSRLYGGRKALDLAAVLKRKIRPAFEKAGITGVGWHTFRHTVGTVLAELGEHQLTIRDYLRHSNLSVTNKYLQAASMTKRNAQARLVEAIVPVHLLPGITPEGLHPSCTQIPKVPTCKPLKGMAGTTGLEPAASAVTGQRSNQLNYVPFFARRTANRRRTSVHALFLNLNRPNSSLYRQRSPKIGSVERSIRSNPLLRRVFK